VRGLPPRPRVRGDHGGLRPDARVRGRAAGPRSVGRGGLPRGARARAARPAGRAPTPDPGGGPPMAAVTTPVFSGRKVILAAGVVAALGFAALGLGLALDPARAWLSYLMALAFAISTSVGGLILLMIGYAANARWMAVVRRPTEVIALPLPALAVLFLPILFGLEHYPWHTPPPHLTAHEREILAHRAPYMSAAPFAIRAAVY